MTDTNNGLGNVSEQQDQSSTAVAAPSSVEAPSSPPVQTQQTPAETDEFINKRVANDLIHKRTKEAADKAYERGKAEAIASQKQNMGLGGVPQSDDDRIRNMMREEIKNLTAEQQQNYEKEAYQKQVNDLANNFMSKIAAAKDSHPELIKRQQEIAELALLVPYINETSEVPGITQHLLDNEGAYANLLVLSQQSPDRVRRALKKIESSVKENDAARSREYPNEPLSQPTPSINAMDSGSGSIEALKKQAWLRG